MKESLRKSINTLSKFTLIILITSILTISAAAIQWDSPQDGEIIGDESTIILELSDATESEYELLFRQTDETEWESIGDFTPSTNDEIEGEWSVGSEADGEYELLANSTDTNDSETITITYDSVEPSFTSIDPSEGSHVSNEDITLSVEAEDDTTSVDSIEITVEEDGDQIDFTSCSTTSCDLTVENRDHGEILDVELLAIDEAGNEAINNYEITVNQFYDGDFDPDFSPNGGDIVMQEDEDVELTITLEEYDELGGISVECLDSGGNTIDSTSHMSVSDFRDYTCEVDYDDYAGTITDIYAEMCDQAGNCVESDEIEFRFDASPPFVDELTTEGDTNVFNNDFDIIYEAVDDASGVDHLEYFFERSVVEGEGTEIPHNNGGRFTVDVSQLESGENRLYFRAVDNVGRWSDVETLDFEYYPDETPEVEVSLDSYETIAEQEGEVEFEVENTGRLFIPEMEVDIRVDGVIRKTETVENFDAGDSINLGFEVAPGEDKLGENELIVEIDSLGIRETAPYIVRASASQQDQITTQLDVFTDRYQNVTENVEELENNGLSDERKERLRSNVSNFFDRYERAEEAADSGDYYIANNILQGLEEDYTKAQQSYAEISEEHRISERNRNILMMVGALLILGLVGAAVYFVVLRDEEEFELDIDFESVGLPAFSLDNYVDRIKDFFEEEEERVEQRFEGFK